MPELPEVETIVRELVPAWVGRKIVDIAIITKKLRYPVPSLDHLLNKAVLGVERRGKYILVKFQEGTLLSHLGMTGKWVARSGQPEKHDHIQFVLGDGKKPFAFFYNDIRKFGFLQWIPKGEQSPFLTILGPEPLNGWTFNSFDRAISDKKTAIKKVIMDNHVVVGVGNIYASEALFRAKIHPEKISSDLTEKEKRNLHEAIQNVLLEGIEAKGASIKNYRRTTDEEGGMVLKLHVYGRNGQKCHACEGGILSKNLGGRNTFWCPNCQSLPKNLTQKTSSKTKKTIKKVGVVGATPKGAKATKKTTKNKNKEVRE